MCVQGRKLKLDELDVSEIEESKGAMVHGAVTELSPVKVSRRNSSVCHYDSKMSDSLKSARIVCFDPDLRFAMEASRGQGSSMCLVNCQVKACSRSTQSVKAGEMKILATSRSKVEGSPRKFVVTGATVEEEPVQVKLRDVSGLSTGQLVTVVIKAMDVAAPEKVKTKDGKELNKEECKICDESGCLRLVLWKKDVGRVEEEESYKLIAVGVRAFAGVKFLSVGVNCVIEKVDDIVEVAEVESEDEEGGIVKRVFVGDIDGVLSAEEYLGCISCNAKVNIVSETVSESTKCGSVSKTNKCMKKMMAKVIISGEDGKKNVVTMFNIVSKVIDSISGDGLSVKLLMANIHKFSNDADVVFSVQKQ